MANFDKQVPAGDTLERRVCQDCGFIDYENPKVVVGAVVRWREQVLLCRRAIEPRRGFWTIPAGYLELGESAETGARREAREEALAEIELEQLLAVYSIPRISQIQLIYKARLPEPDFGAGEETLELALFDWDKVPWDELAFPSVHWALRDWHRLRHASAFAPVTNPVGETGDY